MHVETLTLITPHAQVEKDGMITVMDGLGRIVRSYMGGSSYWDIAAQLTAIGLRFKHNGQVGKPR